MIVDGAGWVDGGGTSCKRKACVPKGHHRQRPRELALPRVRRLDLNGDASGLGGDFSGSNVSDCCLVHALLELQISPETNRVCLKT